MRTCSPFRLALLGLAGTVLVTWLLGPFAEAFAQGTAGEKSKADTAQKSPDKTASPDKSESREKEEEPLDEAQMALNRELIKAAGLGKTAQVKDLLKKGAAIQWRDKADNGKTALAKAILLGKFEVVKLLLEKGADINYPDGSGRYPVYFCVLHKDVEMLNFLLERGGKNYINSGPAPMLVSLCDHGQGSADLIPIIIKAGADPNAYKGNVTALIAAIQLDPKVRKPEIARSYVKALLANKADVNLKDKKGKSPLVWARQRGDQDIIDMLIKAGAEEEKSEPKND